MVRRGSEANQTFVNRERTTLIAHDSFAHWRREVRHEQSSARAHLGPGAGPVATTLSDLYGVTAQKAASKKDVSYADFLEKVLKAERDVLRVRSRERLTRTAGFPALKTLEAYHFTLATGAPRS